VFQDQAGCDRRVEIPPFPLGPCRPWSPSLPNICLPGLAGKGKRGRNAVAFLMSIDIDIGSPRLKKLWHYQTKSLWITQKYQLGLKDCVISKQSNFKSPESITQDHPGLKNSGIIKQSNFGSPRSITQGNAVAFPMAIGIGLPFQFSSGQVRLGQVSWQIYGPPLPCLSKVGRLPCAMALMSGIWLWVLGNKGVRTDGFVSDKPVHEVGAQE